MTEKNQFTDPMRDTEGYLTPEQVEILVSFSKSNRDRVLILFMFHTGRRVSEVVRCLKPSDFNFRDNMVCFSILKRRQNGNYRTWISVSPRAMRMMEEYVKTAGIGFDDYIFPINRFRVDQILQEIGALSATSLGFKVNEKGVPYVGKHLIHAHILRHSFAIHFVKSLPRTMDGLEKLRKLQSVMGHGNINSSNWYLDHFGSNEIKDTLMRMDDEQA